jgi:carbon storage regulator CsrA
MLILTRRPGESLMISDNIKITIFAVQDNNVRIGIEASIEIRYIVKKFILESYKILQNKIALTIG